MNNTQKKKILAISGSTRKESVNLHIIKAFADLSSGDLEIHIYDQLEKLPHFNPDLDNDSVPEMVTELRNKITEADGVLICTPEYVFSLPGSLKNVIEWMVSTTVFSDKPVALITASALGEKAHEALLLIMRTIQAKFNECTQLLISGARSKVNSNGDVTDETTLSKIKELAASFTEALNDTTEK